MGYINVVQDDLALMGSIVTVESIEEFFDDGGEWGSIVTDDDGDPVVVGG